MSAHLLLTIPEAADEIRMSPGYVKKEIREGRLTARKCGRHTRIERRALEVWIQRQPVKIVGNATDHDGSLTDTGQNQVTEKTVSARS